VPRRLATSLAGTLLATASAACLVPAGSALAATPTALLHLRTHDIPLGSTKGFRDTILRRPRAKAHAAVGTGTDSTLTAPDGTPITVTISSQYGNTPEAMQGAQNVVNFLDTRLHSFELALLKVFIGPSQEISSICGAQEALACYAPGEQRMYVPGDRASNSPVPVEYIMTHEFGHHIANHRKNALGSAFIAGPEYWATSQHICAGALLARPPVFFPGDEDQHYLDNPGEGWADSYAHLPENGFESAPFQFNPLFHRDQAAFDAIRRDILQPWSGSRKQTLSGSLGSQNTQTFPDVISLDGPVVARLSGPASANYDLRVRLGGKVQTRTHSAGSRDRLKGLLCGTPNSPPPNTLKIVVVRRSGSGPFKLRLSDAG
jgi:hypothetical protein